MSPGVALLALLLLVGALRFATAISISSSAPGCGAEVPQPDACIETLEGDSRALRVAAAEAESLAKSFRAADRRDAAERLGEILQASSRRGEVALAGWASLRLGELQKSLGLVEPSLQLYQDALQASAELPSLRIAAYLGLSRSLLILDRFDEGVETARRALELSQSLGDGRLESRSLVALGIAHYDSGDPRRALVLLGRALVLAGTVGEERSLAEAHLHIGHARSDLGDERRATNDFETALELSRRLGERSLEASALTALGHTFSKIGAKQKSLEYYRKASPLMEEHGNPFLSAPLHTGMGYLHHELGDYHEAKEYFLRALHHHRNLGSRYGEAGNLLHLGRAQAALGEEVEALGSFSTAFDLLRALGERRMQAVVLRESASLLFGIGRESEAMDRYDRALALARGEGYAREAADILNDLGEIDLRRGDLARSESRFQEARSLSRRMASPFTESRALFNLARLERRAGRLQAALARTEEAIDLVERLRSGIGSHQLRCSYVASIYEIHDFHVDLLMEMARVHPGGGYPQRAFLAAERARARSLLEMLLQDEPQEGAREDPSRRGRREGMGGELALASAEELQGRFLDDRTALLAYFLGTRASYVWVITSSSMRVHLLPPRSRIEAAAREVYEQLATGARRQGETAKRRYDRIQGSTRAYWRAALSLSEEILEEALRDLEVERLVVVGDGALQRIPFSALPIPGIRSPGRPAPLVARYEIVRLPSASVGKALDERRAGWTAPRNRLAILADPVFERLDPRLSPGGGLATANAGSVMGPVGRGSAMSRLLSTRQEARGILDLVPEDRGLQALGFEASRTLVTSGRLAEFEVVHFATHGVLDTRSPELSGIVLSLFDAKGKRQDGYLRLRDIYALDLPVRLVVLSACSTGLGKEFRGEGIVGLAGGFLSTGTLGVIASYWDVDDEATSELMRRFYRNLFELGMRPPKALQAAQSSMWTEKRWLSPHLWAAFEFQGHWRSPAERGAVPAAD